MSTTGTVQCFSRPEKCIKYDRSETAPPGVKFKRKHQFTQGKKIAG